MVRIKESTYIIIGSLALIVGGVLAFNGGTPGSDLQWFSYYIGIFLIVTGILMAALIVERTNRKIDSLEVKTSKFEEKEIKTEIKKIKQEIPTDNLPNKEKEDWLKSYYAKIQSQHDNSFRKKDILTNWSLTILVAMFGIYFGILSGQFQEQMLEQSLRFAVVSGFIIILGQFFSNSLISYAYLRKFRYLMKLIDSRWMNGNPSFSVIVEQISVFDLKDKTVVGMKTASWAQLRAGFAIILGVPTILWISELFQIQNLSFNHHIAFLFLGIFVAWEIWSLWLRKYKRIEQAPILKEFL